MAKGKRNEPRTHTYYVTVREQFPMTDDEVMNKLVSWLNHYGHTSTSFGFYIHAVSIGVEPHRTIERTSQ